MQNVSSKTSIIRDTLSRQLLVVLLFILFIAPALAIIQNGNIKIFAVTEDNKGMAADLLIYAIPGTGKAAFITSNSLVGKDTQTTGNIALQIAQKRTGVKIIDKDIIFDIRANASEVDGPSAGAAMTILAYSMLSEKPLQPSVALTGTINSDGSIGMVGGVGLKAQAASQIGIKLFMIPTGEAVTEVSENNSLKTVNLIDFAQKNLGMKVVEVSNIDEAIKYAYSNIEEIKIDSNITSTIFIPKPITYGQILSPMHKISQAYIDNAKKVIADAKNQLEKTDVSDQLRSELILQQALTQRNIEMAQRFLDQNYLYSSANYAFNSEVMAGTIREVAKNPSLLNPNSKDLAPMISNLRVDITNLKQQLVFVSINDFEWVIGAQQRIAYAENALKNIESSVFISDPKATDKENQTALQQFQFQQVYNYVSAQAWTNVSKDFLKQARASNSKKTPYFTPDFIEKVDEKIRLVDARIKDSNVTKSVLEESNRRLSAAKISFDNNFFLAALFDATFAEAFIDSEINRNFIPSDTLFTQVSVDINNGSTSNFIWANLFFDHAKFYYENAVFNKKLGRLDEVKQSIETSYDLLFLSKKLSETASFIQNYVATTPMKDYKESNPVVQVSYTTTQDSSQLIILFIIGLTLLLLLVLLILGFLSRANNNAHPLHATRRDKINEVLNNLDRALASKKISDEEYFFMKKRYEEELTQNRTSKIDRKFAGMNPDDLRAKQRALERGLIDLRRHYKTGLIIPEDYHNNYKQIIEEINEIKLHVKQIQDKNKQKQSPQLRKGLFERIRGWILKPSGGLRGTEEQVEEEKKEDAKERTERKKILKNFSYRKKSK